MKWKPRLKIYKYSARSKCTFNPATMEGRSYEHWLFFARINNKNVFNNYPYSHTTRSHQWMMRNLLKELKIKIDIEVSQHESLPYLDGALETLYRQLFTTEVALKRKGARKSMISRRKKVIDQCKTEIKLLKKVLKAEIFQHTINSIKQNVIYIEDGRIQDLKKQYELKALERKKNKFTRQINNVLDAA